MLFNCVRRLCSEDKIKEELGIVELCLRENGYPQMFSNTESLEKRDRLFYGLKKPVFLKLGFKADGIAGRIDS